MTKHDKFRSLHVLDVIADFTSEYGHPPSVRDIQSRVGLASPSAVHYHFRSLIREGRAYPCECGCGRVKVAA